MKMNQWLKSIFIGPSNCGKCLEIIEAILDGEATHGQELFLMKHLEFCRPCIEYYNLETAVRRLIKDSVKRKPVPEGLIESIKLKVRALA